MRVWIVNPFDNLPLEGNRPQRYWLLARAFARAGHDVTLWTSDFSHARKAKRVLKVEGNRLKADGFDLVLIETPEYRKNISLARIRSHRVFARRWREAADRESVPEVLIASLPPLALGKEALEFCKRRHVKFVVDVQDAWPETFERVVPRWLLAPLRRTAKKIYCGADAVVGVAQRYVDLARSYGGGTPMKVFRLGIEQKKVERGGERDRTGTSLRLVYLGNMGASYDLETVVEGVKGLEGVTLDLAGSGPKESALRKSSEGCARIRFHGYLDEHALRKLLGESDAALIPMFDSSCVGVPGKLADYASAGLPVLNTLHGETEQLLADYGAGVTYAAGDIAAFRTAVTGLRDADREAMGLGAKCLSREFDAADVYGGYVQWVECLV